MMRSTDDRTRHRARPYPGALAALCLTVLGLSAPAAAATTTIAGTPLTMILLDTQGGRHQIKWNGIHQVYPKNDLNGDSGISFFFNGTSYGFSGNATGGLVGANQLGISSQSALLGSGTAADPWHVVTTFTTDGTVTITQTVYYVNGDDYATFKWSFASTANYNNVKLLHGVDALPQEQDNGYGAHNVACNGLSVSSPQVGPNFFYEFIPVTTPTAYREVLYSTGWTAMRSGTLDNTVNTAWHDAWMGMQWTFNLTTGGYTSILQKLAFGGSACSASSAPPPYLVPTIATAAAASPNPVTTGTTTDLSVLGADDAGEANLTYTWAVTAGPPGSTFSANGTNAAKNSTATFSQAGTYTFQVTVTDQDGFSTTGQVTVDVQQGAASATVAPGSPTLDPHGTQAFTATLYDQFGDAVTAQPAFDWAVNGGGAIDAGGLFTAGSNGGGPFTVTATDPGSGVEGTASVTIQNDGPTIALAAAASPNPVTTGTTTDLSVLGADDGGEGFLTYTWAATAGPAAVGFSANGTNAAKNSTATFTQAGTYTLQVTVADEDGLTSTSAVVVTVQQHATSVAVSPASATVDPNATQPFAATLADQFGNPMVSQPAFGWTVSGGGAIDAGGLFTAGGNGGGPFTVTASDPGSGLQSTASVTIQNDAPGIAGAASATPNPVTSGMTTDLSVLGSDDGGESHLVYTWAVTSGPSGVTFSANGTNAAKSSTATFTQAGTYTFQVSVTDQDGLTVTSSVVVPVDQHATSVAVSPASATVDPNATQAFSATLKDQFGDAMASQPTFGWTVSAGGTVDSSGLFTAGGNGGGPFTVTAADSGSGLQATASVTIQNDAPTVAVAAAASPSPVTTGTTTDLSVLGADDGGESHLTYAWAVTAGPSGVTFGANGSNAAKNSTATFTQAGTYTFRATVTDQDGLTVTSTVVVTVDQHATSVTVSPGFATVDPNATQAFSATVKDQFGNAMASQPAFGWTAGGGTIDSSGLYTAGGNGGGPFTVTATDPGSGVQGTASVSIQNDAPTIATAAAASPNPVTSGTTTDLTVLGADDGGESHLTYTWAVTAGPSGVTFGANGTNAAKSSTATFTQAGTYTFRVTIADQDGVTVTSSVVVPVQQHATSVVVSPASATVAPNGTQAFAASLKDQFGAAMASQPTFTWSVSAGGTVDSSGLFTAGGTAGGPFTVTAADSGSSLQGTGSVTVSNSAPTVATAAAASPNPVTTGTTTDLTVLGADDGGESHLTYTWAVTAGPSGVTFGANGTNAAKSSTATFTQAGTYTFRVTIADQDGVTVTSSVVVPVQQHATSVAVSPASATVAPNGTQAFTASLKDQFGAAMASQPTFTWSVSGGGIVDSSGVFTAGGTAGGPFTVTAADSGSSLQGTGSVTVSNSVPTVAANAAASPNPVTSGTTTSLSVLGADDGGEAHLTYTWAVTSGPSGVTFGANGTHAAKSSTATFTHAGTYVFAVTIADEDGLTTTSQVTVVVQQQVSTITVTPSSTTVGLDGTVPFAASAIDQFGDAVPAPALSWSVSGGGSVDAAGKFQANGAIGSFTVTATAGAVHATATVTVEDMPPFIVSPPVASPNPARGATTTLDVLAGDDGGERNLMYTWSATGPGTVTFADNDSNGAKSTTASFSDPGVYVVTATIRDASGHTTTVTLTVKVQVGQTISDADLYVSRAIFTLAWNQHVRGESRDAISLTGFINPAGLPASLADTTMKIMVGGVVLAAGELSAEGTYFAAPANGPRCSLRLSSKSGQYTIRVSRSDLRPMLAATDSTERRLLEVPVSLFISRARTAMATNRLEFNLASTRGHRARGWWRGPKQRLLDGAFQALRSKASFSKRAGGYIVQATGVIYPMGGGPVMPTADVKVHVAGHDPMVIPLVSLRHSGGSDVTSIWKYTPGKSAPITTFLLKNTKRGFKLKTGPITADGMGLPLGSGRGTRHDVAVRIDIPTADGTIVFRTTPEVVRTPGPDRWKRPAPLVQ